MTAFLAWTGWAGVSAIAQILSLATLIIAVWRFVIQRRQIPLFQLTWDFIATTTLDNGDQFHIVEFRNVGRGSGEFTEIHFAGARTHAIDGWLTPKALGSNETFRLLVTSPDLSKAWIRMMVRTPDHRARLNISWRPLIDTGELFDQWDADLDRWLERSYYDKIRDYFQPPPVGPGGAPRGYIQARHTQEQIAAMFSLSDPDATFYPLLARTDNPPALPYVPPKTTPPTPAT